MRIAARVCKDSHFPVAREEEVVAWLPPATRLFLVALIVNDVAMNTPCNSSVMFRAFSTYLAEKHLPEPQQSDVRLHMEMLNDEGLLMSGNDGFGRLSPEKVSYYFFMRISVRTC